MAICVGCGFTLDERGYPALNTGGTSWPYDCPEACGAPVYCGSEDGVVRTNPSIKSAFQNQTMGAPRPRFMNGGETPQLAMTICNPSECLEGIVSVWFRVTARYQVTPGNRWEVCARTVSPGGGEIIVPIGAGVGAGIALRRVIATQGPLARRDCGAGCQNLVQSGSTVTVAQVVAPGAGKEAGAINGFPRMQRARLDPGACATWRLSLRGCGGVPGSQDTFSDSNLQIFAMLTNQVGPGGEC